jgi:hypothetical protein
MTLPSSWPGYTRANALRGLLIYSSGDSIAALLLGEFSVTRLAVIALLGSTVYALEIPNWFYQVDRMVRPGGTRAALLRTLLALAYFNPLWVARHMALIGWASSGSLPGWGILAVASHAFVLNIPLALTANLLIQNKVPAPWRFTASALYSALMAVYYAVGRVWLQ